jgi:hypothetical protein
MATIAELTALLEYPTETTTIEHKSWLNLDENQGKATLAKAAIGLANEGGGVMVLGMREDNTQGGALGSRPRPSGLKRYSQDAVNAAVNRYADPQFHCGLAFASHPVSNVEHAFILVPGNMTVPVMSRQGVILAQRCYVRKPGPKTEEPFTAEEWREVVERCVAARREDMLDAIRIIVQGRGTVVSEAKASSAILQFEGASMHRWCQFIEDLAVNDDARMPDGHYEITFEIHDVLSAKSALELRHRMEDASKVKHTGWGPFVQLTREAFAPRAVGGCVEAWIGRPVEDRFARDAAHCDFWRAAPAGIFFLSLMHKDT